MLGGAGCSMSAHWSKWADINSSKKARSWGLETIVRVYTHGTGLAYIPALVK